MGADIVIAERTRDISVVGGTGNLARGVAIATLRTDRLGQGPILLQSSG
jgi:hypothetical protein